MSYTDEELDAIEKTLADDEEIGCVPGTDELVIITPSENGFTYRPLK
jgi:hypothetical protein